jgi:hypothetical protein
MNAPGQSNGRPLSISGKELKMRKIALSCAATAVLVAAATVVSTPSAAAPEMYTAWVMCPNGTEIAVSVPIGQAPDPGICLRLGAISAGPRADPRIVGAIKNTAMQASDGMIDINQASPRVLSAIKGMSQEAVTALVKERERAPFSNAEDLAVRLCSRSSIDLSGTDLRIGRITYKRKAELNASGFKCVAGDGGYEILAKKHNYVGHVTLLR